MDTVAESVPSVSELDLLFLGLGLYWAEGAKNERHAISLTNTDPGIIRAYLKFLRAVGANTHRLSANLIVHQDVVGAEARQYWSKITGIPLERIYLTWVKSTDNPVKQKYGTIHVSLQDMVFSRMMFGWLRGLRAQIANLD
jgi:hypothetical protein